MSARVLEIGRRVVYGLGYQRARREAFERVGHLCQLCGARPAAEAHHYALHYPADHEVTANDLTALCRPCHWVATLLRLLDRTGGKPVWFVLATAKSSAGRPRAPRRRPRSCGPQEQPAAGAAVLDLHALVKRCHLVLFVGCMRCRRFVRLDAVEYFRRRGWSRTGRSLRRLSCCRCRSRRHWVVLGGCPRSIEGLSARHPK